MNEINGQQPITAQNADDAGKDLLKEEIIDRTWVMQNTLVVINDGSPDEIRYLYPGKDVLARCEQTGEIGFRKIAHIHTRDEVPTYLLYYRDTLMEDGEWDLRTIEGAPNLPFFVMGKGWTSLKDIRVGDELKSLDLKAYDPFDYHKIGSFNYATQAVLGIKKSGLTRKLYSLELEDFDTYFIQYEGFLIPQQVIASGIASANNTVVDTVPPANLSGFKMHTLVHMEDYRTQMDMIMPGSTVLSRCDKTGELVYRKVLRRIWHESMPGYTLTHNHPNHHLIVFAAAGQQFLLKDRGWTRVSDIKPGDVIEASDGIPATVTSVDIDASEQRFLSDYYDLEIEGGGCYFVDEGLCVRSF